jgi:AcrR family transcriptional regulator
MSAVSAQPQTERVASILEATCRVVVRDGAHGLRMASVAREAGISKALVHYYFATRQELLRNALVFSETRWEEALDEELRGLRTGAARLQHVLLVTVDPKSHFSEQRALWNEVWSTLRFDDDLRPLVEHYYRAWLERIVALVEEGRSDGSVPKRVNAADAGWRLAAAADGFDALLYVGLATREDARRLLLGALQRELAG